MAEEEKALEPQEGSAQLTPQEPTAEAQPEDLKAQLDEARGRLKALEAAQQEAEGLKKALVERDRKIQKLTQQPRDSGEIEELRTRIDALASVLLTDEGEPEEPKPLTKKERYEQALRPKQPPREISDREGSYGVKMANLLKRHGLDPKDEPPEDLVEAFAEANIYWSKGTYDLAVDTMREALQERSQKQSQVKAEEEKVVKKTEERKEGRERLAQNLTRDTTPGEGGPPPNLKRLLEMPVHKMNKAELEEYDKKLDEALRK